VADKPFFANGLNVQDLFQVNSSQVSFGSNIVFTLAGFTVGNSTINVFCNSTAFQLNGATLTTPSYAAGANVLLNSTSLSIGNTTANMFANSILISVANSTARMNLQPTLLTLGGVSLNTTAAIVGANVFLDTTQLVIGNTTVNTIITQNKVRVSDATGVANLEPATLTIGGSIVNTTAVNTSFLKSVTANVTGNTQVYSLGVGGAASGTQGRISAVDNIIAFTSDERLKNKTCNIYDALKKVRSLQGFFYTHNLLANQYGYDMTTSYVGLSAQDVNLVLPEAVHLAPFDTDETGNSKSGDHFLTIQYEKLVPLLIEAIKELENRVIELELED
jgi:hypothetical protein